MAAKEVVYLLGAGFSAPLGIPTMSEFYEKSRELKRNNEKEFSYFDDVFKSMHSLAGAQDYFKGDPFNIEDTLSMLEMTRNLDGGESFSSFTKYISAVIRKTTPDFQMPELNTSRMNWDTEFVGNGRGFGMAYGNAYGCFVASILGLVQQTRRIDFNGSTKEEIELSKNQNRNAAYSILTLNYDMVLETLLDLILSMRSDHESPRVISYQGEGAFKKDFRIVKLHGSILDDSIIPPTFNKGLYLSSVPSAWQEAYSLLKRANEIRVIGYSLPKSDAYIQYILKSAIAQTRELERIDVICWDPDKSVRSRYNDFISFRNYDFYDARTEDYLLAVKSARKLKEVGLGQDISRRVEFADLESVHKNFCSEKRNSK